MSANAAFQDLDFDLVESDGVPLESHYHVLQMILFLELVRFRLQELGCDDAFVGADMFIYYSLEQARAVAEEQRQLRHTVPSLALRLGIEPAARNRVGDR